MADQGFFTAPVPYLNVPASYRPLFVDDIRGLEDWDGGGATWDDIVDKPDDIAAGDTKTEAREAINALGVDDVSSTFRHPVLTLRIVTEDGAEPVDKESYVDCVFNFSNGESYEGEFRGRGNSTWLLPKKPWKVKFSSKQKPMGLPKSKSFCMLANYFDLSSVRNSIYFKLSEIAGGFPFVPKGKHVFVYLNDEYRGLYWFGEDVRLDDNRFDDVDEAGTADGLERTGAYLMEIDRRSKINDDGIYVETGEGVVVAFDEPDGTESVNYDYMEDWLATFEAALMGEDWLDGEHGYAQYVDMPSFASWYLVNELVANLDSAFFSSVKLFKPRDTVEAPGRLHMGAPWDGDLSISPYIVLPYNLYTAVALNTGDDDHNGAVWVRRMLDDPAFKTVLKGQWAELRAFVKGVGLELWLQALSRSLSDARISDTWLWSQAAPKFTDTFLRQGLVSYLRQRSNLIEALLYEGTGSADWEVYTSDTFVPGGAPFLSSRYSDALLGGDPVLWQVSSAENIWVLKDGGIGWNTTAGGTVQQFGLEVDGPMEVEFDKNPHGPGGVRVALGADAMGTDANLGGAISFTGYGVNASYPPTSYYTDIDLRPGWATESYHVKIRLLDQTLTFWVDDVLTWQNDTVNRLGDWLFIDKDLYTTASTGAIIDNLVVRKLPIALGGAPEWLTFTSDKFTGASGSIVGRASDAILGGSPVGWVLNNSSSGWVISYQKLGFSGAGNAQIFGTQVEGPVTVKFNMYAMPSDSSSFTVFLGSSGLALEDGTSVTFYGDAMSVSYTGPSGVVTTVVDEPDATWENADWLLEQVGNEIKVFANGSPIFSAANATARMGDWVSFKKDVNDTEEQYVMRNLQIREKPLAVRNRHVSPGVELFDYNWGQQGGVYGELGTRSSDAAHTGDYGYRVEFDGSGVGELNAFIIADDLGGLRTSGTIWIRPVGHSRDLVMKLQCFTGEWSYLGDIHNSTVTTSDGVWQRVDIPAEDIPETTGVIKLVFASDGWVDGDILDGDDIDFRAG